jgi:hypothetical protein
MEATPMKIVAIVSTSVLSFALGTAVPAYAQQDQHDQQEEPKDKPARQEDAKPQAEKPREKAAPDKNVKQEGKTAQDKNAKEEEKAAHDKNAKQEEKKAGQPDNNAKHEENAARQPSQQVKPAKQGGGGRIPDDRYKAHFGREHTFRVTQADYSRDRRFQYGGYWFGFVDPWPSNWLYTQDVFVVYIDGVYYLCNPAYPGVNITLSVTL